MATEFLCPECGAVMETILADHPLAAGALGIDLGSSRNLRVCPVCKVLAWEENGRTEIRFPQQVPAAEVKKALANRSSGILTVRCPHCGDVNTFGDWSEMHVFICDFCGEPVEVEEPIQ